MLKKENQRSSKLLDELDLIPQSMDKEILITSETIRRRVIHLIDPIDFVTFEQVKNAYDLLIEEDETKPIHFILGTAGGCLNSMLGIMNIMLLSKTPCYTYLLSETFSAGAWIYLCGSKRFAPKSDLVSFMLHPMSWSKEGTSGEHKAFGQYTEEINDRLIAFAEKRTSLSVDKLKDLTSNRTQYFIGNQLFDYKIATDELVDLSFFLEKKEPKKTSTTRSKSAAKKKATKKRPKKVKLLVE